MNLWDGRSVWVKFTAAGHAALNEYFPGESADLVVEATDMLGMWVAYGERGISTAMLLLVRWEFIETARQDVVFEAPIPGPEKKQNVIGFKTL